jgi:TRAP-type C4-dicarboxylate transport system permease small subunit
MQELLYIAIIVVVAGIALVLLATKAGFLLAKIEHYLTYAATALIIFVMLFVCAEVVMRYAFNSPIPGHLEGSELFVPIIVFFAISYTQSQKGHVGMTLVVDALPPGVRRYVEIVTLLLSVLTCAVLSYFSFKYAYNEWLIEDVTMTPPYWKLWPSAAAIPLGYMMIAIRLYLQALHLIAPNYYPQDDVVDDSKLVSHAE